MAVRDPENREAWELMLTYRRVFATLDGQEVLKDMLFDLKFFDTVDTMADAQLHNFGKKLLFKAGIMQDFQVEDIVKAFLSLPYTPPRTSDKAKE